MLKDELQKWADRNAARPSSPNRLFHIRDGNQIIDPRLAEEILRECAVPGELQKKRLATGRVHILHLSEMIKRGFWQDFSQIHFAFVAHRFYLINGYHRLNAVVDAGISASFNVVIKEFSDVGGALSWFSEFDRRTGTRIRQDEQALNAIDFAQTLGVSKQVAKSLFRAIPLIRNGMKPVRAPDSKTRIEMSILEIRADAAYAFEHQARVMNKIIAEARGELKRKMLSPAVFAVALMTVKHHERRAIEFWTNVARNDGLRTGQPEHTLVQTLLSRRFIAGDEENFIIPALAWNAFFESRSLTTIKSGAVNSLRIAGTPIGSRGSDNA